MKQDDGFKYFFRSAIPGAFLLIVMWSVYIVDWIFSMNLFTFGILPRDTSGLWGIIFTPFLHGGLEHIVNNSPPILILSWALFYFYRQIAFQVLSLSWLLGGILIWLAARGGTYHIGMSGVIYSLAFFIFFSGVFRRETKVMAIALFVAFLYGSMIWGVFPIDPRISWEAHLYGAIIGVVLAHLYRNKGETFKKKKYQFEIDEENEQKLFSQGYRKVMDENGFTVRYIHKDSNEEYHH
ncbi:MAG: rhomboid family intramembrane serine protease [Flavobacteriales bacterium]|nr:rhomboid family intramembrane serine protease [Flavobacteriales bacterium]